MLRKHFSHAAHNSLSFFFFFFGGGGGMMRKEKNENGVSTCYKVSKNFSPPVLKEYRGLNPGQLPPNPLVNRIKTLRSCRGNDKTPMPGGKLQENCEKKQRFFTCFFVFCKIPADKNVTNCYCTT